MEIAKNRLGIEPLLKLGLGSDSTMDANNNTYEDPIETWYPMWAGISSSEIY